LFFPQGLFKGAGVLLKPGGVLFTYGVGAAGLSARLGGGASHWARGVPGGAEGGWMGGQLWAWRGEGLGKAGGSALWEGLSAFWGTC